MILFHMDRYYDFSSFAVKRFFVIPLHDNLQVIEVLDLRTLQDRLKWALREKAMSKAELARLLGVRASTIQDLTNGQTKRSTRTVEIANILGVSSQWLATGKGSPTRWPELTPKALALAGRFDLMPEKVKAEIIGYVDYVTNRETDPNLRGLEPLAVLLNTLNEPDE